ncbi:MAG: Peptidase S26 [Smithella sp. PtaU1.Bin162]|nr:MAG: Peptidase S26 [Smithella sp. PtaU1.Bin162]
MTSNNKKTKWTKFKIFILVILILIAGAAIPNYFAVTTTASLNKRIFFINKGKQLKKLKTGDYVMFSLLRSKRENDLPAKLVRMIEDDGEELQIKRIGCSAGEEIKNIGNKYYCKNELIAMAKDYSLGGERLKKFEYSGKIPEGDMFLVGDHIDSYDSRYFGFIKAKDIIVIVYPLL